MRIRVRSSFVVACLFATAVGAQPSRAAWPGGTHADTMFRAAAAVVRLPPKAFPQLPKQVREDLESDRCMIPQASPAPADASPATIERIRADFGNVVRGQFFERGRFAWAVLCSVDGVTAVWFVPEDVLVWDITQLRAMPDTAWVEPDGSGGGKVTTTIMLTTTTARLLNDSSPALDASERTRARHDALLLADRDGASDAVYWTGRRWVRLPGTH